VWAAETLVSPHLPCRTIMAEHFGSLALPVGEFLALEHGTGAPVSILSVLEPFYCP